MRSKGLVIVAYLAHRREGISSLERFINSLRKHPSGYPYELVLLTKGFIGEETREWTSWVGAIGEVPYRRHDVPEGGFDLGAYRNFIHTATGRTVLFLNSHSEILVDGWLDLLVRHSEPGCLVGVTGSWESHLRDRLVYYLDPEKSVGFLRRRARSIRFFLQGAVKSDTWCYPLFPNPAIRTTGMLVSPDLHNLIKDWPIPKCKEDCHQIESGWSGLSRKVMLKGGKLLLVGADGLVSDPAQWPDAAIFRSSQQQRLIIADNQTRLYAQANPTERQYLGWMAWGARHVQELL